MKNYLENFKKYFHKNTNIDLIRDPQHDWNVLLIGFISLLIIVVAVNGFLLYKISRGELFKKDNVDSLSNASIQPNALKNLADTYNSKQESTEALLSGSTTISVVDPS